ncbi:tyrosine-type recombinase/integrase [Neotabrizicola shimadae]|uniref:Tyrosine-type recombinase/integrase n=1 Tax=Neotabrizicola shimadae TaxID=2807096 RepID=A0A8G0ZU02_9RHOB|nr:tyrosine-type recombinase/integrase [Neotabrizicola shimadae]QYZ70052.1 tyrosine-type recombinase/integrase [Neotabrizicola shimadae]
MAVLTTERAAALSGHVAQWGNKLVQLIKTGFNAVLKRAGLEGVTPRVLRQTAAVHMAKGGVPMEDIAQFLGHSNTQTTRQVYARFSPDHLRRAANVLEFGKIRKVQ